jgi:hypothetical protein
LRKTPRGGRRMERMISTKVAVPIFFAFEVEGRKKVRNYYKRTL